MRGMRTPQLLSKDEAQSLLAPHSSLLVTSMRGSFDDWSTTLTKSADQTAGLGKRTQTCFIHDRVVDRLTRAEAANKCPGLRVRKHRGLWVAIINDRLMLKLKKLDLNLRSRNISTGQTQAFNTQTPLMTDVPSATNATGGYVVDRIGAEPIGIVVVCWNGDAQHWAIDLDGSASQNVLEIPGEATPRRPIRRRTRVVAPPPPDKQTGSSDE